LPANLREAIADSEALTANGRKLHLRLAVDYSARHTIFQAASKFYKVTDLSSEAFSNILAEVQRGGSTDVDLLIRTGGEQRLSDFLLWECAFAEFCFLPKRWPRFHTQRPARHGEGVRAAGTNARRITLRICPLNVTTHKSQLFTCVHGDATLCGNRQPPGGGSS